MKLCVDCKWCVKKWTYVCSNPELLNPVTGKAYIPCAECRSEMHLCMPGFRWEAK